MSNYEFQSSSISKNSLDIRGFFNRLLKHWSYFAISLAVFILLALLVIKSTPPTYEINTTLLISERSEAEMPGDAVMQGLRQYGTNRTLENEIGYLTSFNLIREVVDTLDLAIVYLEKGFFRDVELYKNFPVQVVMDSTHPQLLNQQFFVKFLGGDNYEIRVESPVSTTYTPGTREMRPNPDKPFTYSGQGTIGTPLTTDLFSFTLYKRKEDTDLGKFRERNLYFTYKNPDVLTDNYRKRIKVEPISLEATVVDIKVEGEVVKKETDVLTTLTGLYIGKRLREKNHLARKTIEFIDGQISDVSDSLQTSERTMASIRASQGTFNPAQTAADASNRLYQLETEYNNLDRKLRYCRTLQAELADSTRAGSILAPSTVGIDDPLLNQLVADLKTQYTEKVRLEYTTGRSSLERDILQKKIQTTSRTLIGTVNDIVSKAESDLQALAGQMGGLRGVIRTMPRSEADLLNVQRRFSFKENHYNYLLQKRTEAAITMMANTPDSKVLDAARSVGSGPVAPNSALIMALSIVFALLIPTLIVYAKDVIDDTVKGQSQVERIAGVPVLGAISHNRKDADIYELNNLTSEAVESLRYLKVNLQFVASDRQHKIIGITSTIPKEGKTFTTFNLAAVTAISGHRVLVIGADIRKPALYKVAKVENTIGLTNFLINQASVDQIIQRTHIKDLDIITSGPVPPNPTDLLNRPQLKDMFEELRKRYDYIFVDTPPVGLVSDFLLLVRHTDVNLYVVRQGYSKVHFLEDIEKLKSIGKGNRLYMVLNDVKYTGKSYYGYKYGKRYPYKYGVEMNGNGRYGSLSRKVLNSILPGKKKTTTV